MAKKPIRKRLKHVKKGRKGRKEPQATTQGLQVDPADHEQLDKFVQLSTIGESETDPSCCDTDIITDRSSHQESGAGQSVDCVSLLSSPRISNVHPLEFHDYCKTVANDTVVEEHSSLNRKPQTPTVPSLSVLQEAKQKIELFMSPNWFPFLESDGVNIILLSRDMPRTAQRNVFFRFTGEVKISVHCQEIDANHYLKNATPAASLCEDTVNEFVDRVSCVINSVRLMEICAGVENERFECVWQTCPGGRVDLNPYRETRYVESFRSLKCALLVNVKTWRCTECSKLLRPLRRRLLASQNESPHLNTPNVHLTTDQLLNKVESQRKEIDTAKKKIRDLHQKIQDLVAKEGVPVDDDLSSDLACIMRSKNLSPAQEVFLHQQVKASSVKKSCGMRWHPTMIRLALSVHLTSPAAYELMRDSGMVKLPSSRTLFDYSRVKPISEGIDKVVLDSVAQRVSSLKPYQKFHVLMADEMYISKNLVFQKSSGRMIGYTKLDEVDREVRSLNEYLDGPHTFKGPSEEIASRVLCYMIKGIANSIKEVVACYAVSNVSANQMYLWTWHVIGALERNGIKIVSFVCDGSSTNRAFINLHTPMTKLKSGLVFDTLNKAAPGRVLYFMSDVAHLLKTIRNCFYKSRANKKNGTRCLTRRGQKIVWEYIIRMYKEDKSRTLRRSFKLNPVNVFPDAYSCMKVSYAAQVLSRTVASDLESKKYKGVSETVKFIRSVNDWFDQLNGAHTSVGKKKKNSNLDPYTSSEDERFKKFENFLEDLEEWKAEAYQAGDKTINSTVNESLLMNETHISEPEVSFHPVEDDAEAEPGDGDGLKASQRVLSHQTQAGIEITTQAFIKCVKFLLSEGTPFINARIFSQDPLEQFFSKQRAGGGGSTNPNLQKFLGKCRGIHIQGQLGIKRRKGNSSEVCDSHVVVTTEPLAKRKCERQKSL